MGGELCFALRCRGSRQRPALRRQCSKCMSGATYVSAVLDIPPHPPQPPSRAPPPNGMRISASSEEKCPVNLIFLLTILMIIIFCFFREKILIYRLNYNIVFHTNRYTSHICIIRILMQINIVSFN